MTKHADITRQNNTLQLQGDVNFANVMSIYKKSMPLIASLPALVFDFSSLTSSHSAILALMVEWVKQATQQSKPVQFINVSADMLAIAKLAGLSKLFDFA